MKKIVLSMIVIVFSLTLLACGKDSDDVESIDFEFHVLGRTDRNWSEEVAKLMNLMELENYIYKQGVVGSDFQSFIAERYTANFFAQNYILLISLIGGGGDSFVVENIEDSGNIHIAQTRGNLTDIAHWVIVIELPKTVNISNFNIELRFTNRPF